MPLFDKFQQQQMTHQPAPEQTDTYRAINQYFKDVATGKVAKESLQHWGQTVTMALAGDPRARAELVGTYLTMTPFGKIGQGVKAGAETVAKAAPNLSAKGALKTTVRDIEKNMAGLTPEGKYAGMKAAIDAGEYTPAKMAQVHREIAEQMKIRQQLVKQARLEEAARVAADREFKKQQLRRSLKRGAIQDSLAIGGGAAGGTAYSELAKYLNDYEEE